jgi:hypothetical protein
MAPWNYKGQTKQYADNRLMTILRIGTRSLILALAVFCAVPRAMAQTAETTTDRRIEEEKRLSLQPTEAVIDPQKQEVRPRQAINRDYFRRLVKQSRARKVDGVYTVMVLLGKAKQFKSFPEELQYLKDNGYIPKGPDWDLKDSLTKGEMAFMLCKALKVKGGVHLRLFGVSPRYALAELVYMGIMVRGREDEVMTGKELAYTFIEAADHLAGKSSGKTR